MKRIIVVTVLVIGILSTSYLCFAKLQSLGVGNGSIGFAWKRATDTEKKNYCLKIAVKVGMTEADWDVFYKSLNTTFDTSNPITLRMSVDDTAKAIHDDIVKRAVKT